MTTMETMSALDSAFLQLEDRHASLHIGSVGIFEGPAPAFTAITAEIAGRLHRVPRYRQRMLRVPGNFGRPVWQDDPDFDLTHHLRRTALPDPGGDLELQDLVGRIMSQPLDHDRPLWEDWVVEGLAGDRWAVVSKVHHSVVDGIAGTDLLTSMFGSVADDDPQPIPDGDPTSLPRRLTLVARGVREVAGQTSASTRAAATAVGHPRVLARTTRDTADGLLHFLTALRPVSRTSLIGPIGSSRRYRWAEIPLDEVLSLRTVLGCTVNDVVLAAVTLAYQTLLIRRGEQLSARAVRTLVPVSVRHADERGRFDNRVSAMLVDLPVDKADPAAVVDAVAKRMRRLKASHEADAGEVVTSLGNAVPPPGLAAGLRLAFGVPQRVVTTVTTNVPGPREVLHLGGRRMLAAYPYVPIADRLRTGIAVTSYGDKLLFGITADWQSTPDVDVLRDALLSAFTELARCGEDRSH
jgi:diacylglycerol O-acyltransferase